MRRLLISMLGLVFAASATQAATVGFTESFNGGLAGWGGGSNSYLNIASGGVGGAADGYLAVENTDVKQLATRNSGGDYTGDLIADGVTGVSFWLSELDTDDGLEIHVGVGQAFGNFWISNAGFTAPAGGWAQFSVDFSDPSQWTQTIGGGTFAGALQNSSRLLFRHDSTPVTQPPASTVGGFGVDEITIVPEPASLLGLFVGGCFLAIRRR